MAKWIAGCDGEENEERDIAALYSAYHSQIARNYFMDQGLLNKAKTPCAGLSGILFLGARHLVPHFTQMPLAMVFQCVAS